MLKVGSLILFFCFCFFLFLENIIHKIWIRHKGSQIFNVIIAEIKLSICFKSSLHYLPTFVLPCSSDPPCIRTAPPPAEPPAGVPAARCPGLHTAHRPPPPPTPPPPPQRWRAPSVTVGLLLSSQPAHFDLFLRCLEVRNRRVLLSLNYLFIVKDCTFPPHLRWDVHALLFIIVWLQAPLPPLPPLFFIRVLNLQPGGRMTSSTIASCWDRQII